LNLDSIKGSFKEGIPYLSSIFRATLIIALEHTIIDARARWEYAPPDTSHHQRYRTGYESEFIEERLYLPQFA